MLDEFRSTGDPSTLKSLTDLVRRYPSTLAIVKTGLIEAVAILRAKGPTTGPDAIEAATRAAIDEANALLNIGNVKNFYKTGKVGDLGLNIMDAYRRAAVAPLKSAIETSIAELKAAGLRKVVINKSDIVYIRAIANKAWNGDRRLPGLKDVAEKVRSQVEARLVRGLDQGESVQKITNSIKDIAQLSSADAYTTVNTHYQDIARQVMNQKTQDLTDGLGVEVTYEYVGPLDKVTRPFCAALVGQVKTQAEWEALDNHQNGNAFNEGGGYNCRHRCRLVLDEKLLAAAGNMTLEQQRKALVGAETGGQGD